jgi:hypothetical protein
VPATDPLKPVWFAGSNLKSTADQKVVPAQSALARLLTQLANCRCGGCGECTSHGPLRCSASARLTPSPDCLACKQKANCLSTSVPVVTRSYLKNRLCGFPLAEGERRVCRYIILYNRDLTYKYNKRSWALLERGDPDPSGNFLTTLPLDRKNPRTVGRLGN